ncbi:MAG: alpha-galactosidase [Planctomycetia bacterium]|nr:alpha-galactosidase [Planctomycetia bacterium]
MNRHTLAIKGLFTAFSLCFVLFFNGVAGYGFETLNKSEQVLKSRWISAKFDGVASEPIQTPDACLEVVQNHDPVFLDNRGGKKLQIGGKLFDRGLYCHAPSHINVFLPQGAKRFMSTVGVDTNADQTRGGNGSVRFHVQKNNQDLIATEVLHGNEAGVDVNVELGGATTFSLLIDDGGDGISCDQSDWAEARVELEDGTILILSDLELIDNAQYDRTLEVAFPFSFIYDGKSSSEFLNSWQTQRTASEAVDGKVTRTVTFTEPNGRLQVKCTAIDYIAYPFVEWTLNFKNLSNENTPIIEKIQPIDMIVGRDFFERRPYSGWDPECGEAARWNQEHEFKLHYSKGSPYSPDDYWPYTQVMNPGDSKDVATVAGRATGERMPYFNIESYKKGWIVVLGWSGQWSSNFKRQGELELHVTAGQELTHFKLLPGEEVRSPIAVAGPWVRDSWIDAQNVWRRWMLEYNVPRVPDKDNLSNVKGKLISHHLAACSSHFFAEMTRATTATQEEFIQDYLDRGIKLDYWWMDAGWYPCEGNWAQVGTWEVDKTRFPNGLREVSDYGRDRGVQTIVWFEPERVEAGSWLAENHPEWLMGRLLNLGNPEALDWLINHIDGIIKDEGIDLYRQDYNIAPLAYWREADAEDRQGIAEIAYVTGYLKYWDALLERNPGLRIDSCASGGNRNDLETMRRAVPLLRSDWLLEPTSQQVHSYGIALWIPLFGTGTRAFDDYKNRSIFVPYLNYCYDVRRDDSDWDNVRSNLKIWRENVAPYFVGDYYPLTSISSASDAWMGWQYNLEEEGKGVIQMFARPDTTIVSQRFKLHGLDSSATYRFSDVDSDATFELSGEELMTKGLVIEIDSAPTAKVINYQKL